MTFYKIFYIISLMKTNNFDEVILNEKDILRVLYLGKIQSFKNLNFDNLELINQFNQSIFLNGDSIEPLTHYQEPQCSKEEFDKTNQEDWFIPIKYQNFPIEEWLIKQCKTEIELERVLTELELYQRYNMIPVLKVLKYLVDFMRENNILWGVGRGSSVSSYCLFLIGLHKIDSIKFNLDISEFLKGEKNE